MQKETILSELRFKLGLIRKHTTVNDILCAKFNLSYTMDTSIGHTFHVFENALLPIARTKDEENEFFTKLDVVNTEFNDDPLWDCSGTVWLRDGSWLELVISSGESKSVTFKYSWMPDIPEELINVID
jgi:hypothetical protein